MSGVIFSHSWKPHEVMSALSRQLITMNDTAFLFFSPLTLICSCSWHSFLCHTRSCDSNTTLLDRWLGFLHISQSCISNTFPLFAICTWQQPPPPPCPCQQAGCASVCVQTPCCEQECKGARRSGTWALKHLLQRQTERLHTAELF